MSININFDGVPKYIDQGVLRQHVLDCMRLERYDPRLTIAAVKHVRIGYNNLQQALPVPNFWRRYDALDYPMDVGEFMFCNRQGEAVLLVVTYNTKIPPLNPPPEPAVDDDEK